MMKRIALATALLGLAACGDVIDFRSGGGGARAPQPAARIAPPPPPAPVVLTAKERLVAAIEDNGCMLDASNVGAVLDQAVIGQSELLTLAPELEAEGRAEVSGSGAIRVMTDRCI